MSNNGNQLTTYTFTCTHNFPVSIQLSVRAESEEDALEAAIDEFYGQFEETASVSRDLGTGWKYELIQGGKKV